MLFNSMLFDETRPSFSEFQKNVSVVVNTSSYLGIPVGAAFVAKVAFPILSTLSCLALGASFSTCGILAGCIYLISDKLGATKSMSTILATLVFTALMVVSVFVLNALMIPVSGTAVVAALGITAGIWLVSKGLILLGDYVSEKISDCKKSTVVKKQKVDTEEETEILEENFGRNTTRTTKLEEND